MTDEALKIAEKICSIGTLEQGWVTVDVIDDLKVLAEAVRTLSAENVVLQKRCTELARPIAQAWAKDIVHSTKYIEENASLRAAVREAMTLFKMALPTYGQENLDMNHPYTRGIVELLTKHQALLLEGK